MKRLYGLKHLYICICKLFSLKTGFPLQSQAAIKTEQHINSYMNPSQIQYIRYFRYINGPSFHLYKLRKYFSFFAIVTFKILCFAFLMISVLNLAY